MIVNEVNKIEEKVINARRAIHENPELSFEEYKTADFICDYLDNLGIPYRRGIAKTGILAEIKGGKEGKTVLLRADMDGLPVEELNEIPFKSKNRGIMHACGHDVHIAIMLGVCEVIWNLKSNICGTVKIAFQPGEETSGGALPMIEEGVLENPKVDICAAFHVDPDMDCGVIGIKDGPLYASPDDFEIIVKGKGGHGAQPEGCIDPIYISAQIISSLHLVAQSFESAVVSVCSVHSGTANNIIPDTAVIAGTARSLTAEVREKVKCEIGRIAEEICRSNGAECEYNYTYLFPPLINSAEVCELFAKSAEKYTEVAYGKKPAMLGEDFAYFAEKVPSALIKLGVGKGAPLHNSGFSVDENCIKTGICVMSDFVLEYLK